MVGVNIITKTIKWIVGAFFASTILAVVASRFVPVYVTPLMLIRVVEQTFSDEYDVKWEHHWVPLKEMSKYMPVAVMASEDARFLKHHGFDFDAIQKAVKHNKTAKTKHGASTITQQTAKNVFLWPVLTPSRWAMVYMVRMPVPRRISTRRLRSFRVLIVP